MDVSVIVPIHNAERWLNECLESILKQELNGLKVELSVFLDACTDSSRKVVESWIPRFQASGFAVKVDMEENQAPKGVGFAKNRAVSQSRGQFLCFMDADDVMLSGRIRTQHKMATDDESVSQFTIVGSKFKRLPEDSTKRYTKWANNLSPSELTTQIFTSHGPTIIMPTWFCHRSVFDRVGGFVEKGRGHPEDLVFFYKHLRLGGAIARADEVLILYRYHPGAATFSVHEDTIWNLRVKELEERVLMHWTEFTIWNGGKQGRKLYRSLSEGIRNKVSCFCDVDEKKIGTFYTYEFSEVLPKPKIPIIHFREAKSPFIICVKLDMTGGSFETNLKSLNLKEGVDYYHFN